MRRYIYDIGEKEMSQVEYKEIEDWTNEVKRKLQNDDNFPKAINIISVKLLLGPDGAGGLTYFIYLQYEMDGVVHAIRQRVYARSSETLMHLLDSIKDFYERMHNIKL